MNNAQNKTENWVGEDNFEVEVLIPAHPVLVAFLDSWSSSSLAIESAVDKAAVTYANQLKVVKVNTDTHPALRLLYHIKGIPTLVLFVNGIAREKIIGELDGISFLSKFSDLLPFTAPTTTSKSHIK